MGWSAFHVTLSHRMCTISGGLVHWYIGTRTYSLHIQSYILCLTENITQYEYYSLGTFPSGYIEPNGQ